MHQGLLAMGRVQEQVRRQLEQMSCQLAQVSCQLAQVRRQLAQRRIRMELAPQAREVDCHKGGGSGLRGGASKTVQTLRSGPWQRLQSSSGDSSCNSLTLGAGRATCVSQSTA